MNNDRNEKLEKKILLEVDSIDEALKIAAKKFGVPEAELKSKVTVEGKKGFFGFFSRKMQVEVTYTRPEPPQKESSKNQKTKRKNKKSPSEPVTNDSIENVKLDAEAKLEADLETTPAPETKFEANSESKIPEQIEQEQNSEQNSEIKPEEKIERIALANRSIDFLNSVLGLMDFDCKSEIKDVNLIEITGEDASDYVVGHYGDALKSLEYLVNLALRDPKKEPRLRLDSCGYRERRIKNLERLAEATARQAVRFGRPVKLDPMASWERWVIHTTLKNRDDVTTESIGEPPLRKVVIMPKFDASRSNSRNPQRQNSGKSSFGNNRQSRYNKPRRNNFRDNRDNRDNRDRDRNNRNFRDRL